MCHHHPTLMIPYAKPTAALDQLPKQLREQVEPYFEYFDKKFKEIHLRKSAPLELDDQSRLKLEYSDGSDANLEPGTYATGSFKNGKRAVMLGTVAGTVALYESSDTIDVPENVSADRKLQVPSFELHVPEVFWKAGLLKLTILGKVDLSTFIDLFGYPKQNNRDDHNRNNIANRLAVIADALNLRPSAGFAKVEEAAFEQAAKICDLAIEQSEAESKQCLPHEFVEKAVFRGAIAQAKKIASAIRALKHGSGANKQEDTEARF